MPSRSFAVATRAGQAEDLGDELDSLVRDVLGQHAEGRGVPHQPRLVTRRSARADPERGIERDASPLLRKFIGVLNQNNRLDLLPAIASRLPRSARRTGRPRSRLGPLRRRRSAKTNATNCAALWPSTLGKEPILAVRVDPDLLGGLIDPGRATGFTTPPSGAGSTRSALNY